MDATELARWTRFAARGGIGKCTAVEDCVAERVGDLMFLKDDEITVLMQLTDHEGMYLGYCEGVVGKFKGVHVQFHSKLKKAIIAKRSSLRDGHPSKSPTPSVHSIFAPSSPVDSIHHRSSTGHSIPSRQGSTMTSDDEAVPPLSHSSGSLRSDSVLNTPTNHPLPSDNLRTSNSLDFPTSEVPLSSTRLPSVDKPNASHSPLSVPEKTNSPQSGGNLSLRPDETLALPPSPPRASIPDSELTSGSPPVASLVASPPKAPESSQPNLTTAPAVLSPEPLEDDPPDTGIDDEWSKRASDAMSDGEVEIGLSFLQDDDDDDDWSSTNSRYSVGSVSRGQDKRKGKQVEDSQQSEKAKQGHGQKPEQEAQIGQRKESPTPSVSHPTLHGRRPSLAPSASSKRSEDWEGAAGDIYDNYRYSRYSVSSKMSRFSTMSHPSTAPTDDAIPPVPDARPSVDVPVASEVLVEEKRSSTATDASVYTQASKQEPLAGPQRTTVLTPPEEKLQGRPSPLELNKASPLLSTTWGSPTSSPGASPMSSRFSGGLNPPTPLSHLTTPTTSGVASALRHRLESERPTPTPKTSLERASTAADFETSIVVDDDEEILAQVVPDTPVTEEPGPINEPLPSPYDKQPSTPSSHAVIPSTPTSEPIPIPTIKPPAEIPSHVQNELAPPPPTTVHPTARSHLRPSLAELRGSDEPERRSLFLPHPGAPRAPAVGSSGPMYLRSQQPSYSSDLSSTDPHHRSDPQHPPGYPHSLPQRPVQFIDGVPAGSSVHMARVVASSVASPPHMTSGRAVRPTMYGRMELDLASSTGPVLIIFSLEPPPSPPAAHLSHQRAGLGIATPPFPSSGEAPAPPIVPRIVERPASVDRPIPLAAPAGSDGVASAIPRANFTPRAGMVRPRSRSFSGFNSASATTPEQTRKVTSREEGSVPLGHVSGSVGEGRKSLGSNNAQPPTSSPFARGAQKSTSKPPPKSSPLRNAHAPSPLSLPGNNLRSMPPKSPTMAKPPPSPLSQSSFQPPPSPAKPVHTVNIGLPARPSHELRQATSMSVLNESKSSAAVGYSLSPPTATLPGSGAATSPNTLSTSLIALTPQPRKSSLTSNRASSNNVENAQPALPVHTRQLQNQHRPAAPSSSSSVSRPSITRDSMITISSEQHSSSSHPTRPSTETDTMSIKSARSLASPPPSTHTIGRQNSLRSKLSLPNLQRTRSNKVDDGDGPVGFHVGGNGEVMQVEDMDFELVRPNIPAFNPAPRASEDSSMLHPRDTGPSLEVGGGGYLRAESPAVSMSSSGASGQRSPTVPSFVSEGSATGANASSPSWPPITSTTSAQRTTESSVEAHRQRELKWMSILNTVTAAQAKKNKKIRKLLGEGVPASVRYRIWCLLTDGNGRFVQRVYAQLGGMGRTNQVYLDVEKDAKAWFAQHERQSGHGGGSVSHMGQSLGPQTQVLGLLQAYLAMVPDLQYSIGLMLVAGHLLLLAPEEDAFWIFVSMMDTFLRPYFTAASVQIEVDAALFAKALEANDAQVGKKVLVDLSVMPATWCHPWFSSLFVDILPTEYLDRVWDLFLYEGVPFLIRVGLAIMVCCRRQILDCPSEESLLNMLKRPSPTWLPSTPEGFITLALSFKVKDDEIRKQRVKMEAQVKRQIQAPRKNSAPGSISLPRS